MFLEKGMKIYCRDFIGNPLARFTIHRTTEKQAIVLVKNTSESEYEIRFDREVKEGLGFFSRGSNYSYSRKAYYLETPELISEYNRRVLEWRFSKIKVEDLSTDQLERIIEISKENLNEGVV